MIIYVLGVEYSEGSYHDACVLLGSVSMRDVPSNTAAGLLPALLHFLLVRKTTKGIETACTQAHERKVCVLEEHLQLRIPSIRGDHRWKKEVKKGQNPTCCINYTIYPSG